MTNINIVRVQKIQKGIAICISTSTEFNNNHDIIVIQAIVTDIDYVKLSERTDTVCDCHC